MNTLVTKKLTREIIMNLLRQPVAVPTEPYQGVERRKHTRWKTDATIEFWPLNKKSKKPMYGQCRNISIGGLGMICDQILSPNTALGIVLHLNDEGFHGRADVRYCLKEQDRFMVGLEFVFNDWETCNKITDGYKCVPSVSQVNAIRNLKP
ncbi:MAG: PilZ domain-containing protein [Planctomycetota bacterium]|nr:MAG: PilZ domain-containing protein [Planctomycetota bacterium]